MKQLINQKRESFYVSIRKQQIDEILFEKRWQCLKQQQFVQSELTLEEQLKNIVFSLQHDQNEDLISEEIIRFIDRVFQIKRDGKNIDHLQLNFQSNLKILLPLTIKKSFEMNNFTPLINFTYAFNYQVCNELIIQEIYPRISVNFTKMIREACLILSNIFVEDETVKFTFHHQLYRTQFNELINIIACKPGFDPDINELFVRIGTNSFTQKNIIIGCFSFLLKISYIDSRDERGAKSASRVVQKNVRDLNQQMLSVLCSLNLGMILNDKNYSDESKYQLLNMLTHLLQYDYSDHLMDQLLTVSLVTALENLIKSLSQKNKILVIKIVMGLCMRSIEQQAKILNSKIMEILIRILQTDCMLVKVDVLQTFNVCLKSSPLRNQLLSLDLISYLVPLLSCDHKETIIQTMKCTKTIFTRTTEEQRSVTINWFKQLNGPQKLEQIFEIDLLAEQLLSLI